MNLRLVLPSCCRLYLLHGHGVCLKSPYCDYKDYTSSHKPKATSLCCIGTTQQATDFSCELNVSLFQIDITSLHLERAHHHMQGDFPVSKMVNGLQGVNPKRKAKLLDVLDVDLEWRMHLVSDGQRRRVQLLMGLLQPFKVTTVSGVLSFLYLISPDVCCIYIGCV